MVASPNHNYLLWESFKEGNKDSFEKIYHQYFKSLYEYGLRTVNDKEIVKDHIHDLFVKLWTNRNHLGEVKNIKSYLLVSLRNLIFDKIEKNKRIQLSAAEEDYYFEMTFSVESKFIEQESYSEQTKKLITALNNLSSRQKEIIYLKYFEELEYNDIAAILNISTKATYKLSARAINALKEILNLPDTYIIFLLALAKAEIL